MSVQPFDMFTRSLPPGSLLAFAAPTPPQGFLVCNGDAVSREQYAQLFATIGTIYGIGDGRTTFNLPDCRGLFLRGLDLNRGYDMNKQRLIGSFQDDSLRAHNHRIWATMSRDDTKGDPAETAFAGGFSGGPDASFFEHYRSSDTGGSETVPKNMAALYVIKF